MKGGIKIELRGIKELQGKFKQLTEKMIKKAMKRAALAGAEIIRTDASRRATPYSKRISSNMLAKVTSQKPTGIVIGVGPTKEFWWGRFIELGHNIYAGKRKRRSARIVARVPAHPFLRPAIDENEARVVATVAAEFQKEIRAMCK